MPACVHRFFFVGCVLYSACKNRKSPEGLACAQRANNSLVHIHTHTHEHMHKTKENSSQQFLRRGATKKDPKKCVCACVGACVRLAWNVNDFGMPRRVTHKMHVRMVGKGGLLNECK